MHISLPEKVENIISTIEANGFEAYAVGDCDDPYNIEYAIP